MAASDHKRVSFILLIILALPAVAYGQDFDLNKEVTLRPGSFRLDSLLKEASQQAGAVFSFNSKKLNVHQRISVKKTTLRLAEILDILKAENGISIKIIENYIIINSVNTKEEKKIHLGAPLISSTIDPGGLKQVQIPVSKKAKSTEFKADSSEAAPKIEGLTTKTSVLKTDSTKINATGQIHLPSENPPPILIDSTKIILAVPHSSEKRDSTRAASRLAKPRSPSRKMSFLFRPGIVMDESLYSGVVTQLGLPMIYVTISVNTNFCVSQIRYGLGTSFKLNERLHIHFNASFGSLEKSGQFTDSAGYKFPISVKGQLTRIGVAAELSLNKKIKLQIGPVFNQLKTNYFINSVPSNLSLFKANADRLFYTIYPPYLITNTYSPTTDSNKKVWVGLQVSLLYLLDF